MTTHCSQCGARKMETNHWWFAWRERAGTRYCAVEWEIDPNLVHEESVEKICGITCLTVSQAKWAQGRLNIGARV